MKLRCMQLACDSLMLHTNRNKGESMLYTTQLTSCCMSFHCHDNRRSNFYIETGLLSVLNLHYEHQFPHSSFDKDFDHQYILIYLEFHSIL